MIFQLKYLTIMIYKYLEEKKTNNKKILFIYSNLNTRRKINKIQKRYYATI